ncbi:hypothetical protein D770_16280 [Flammeovirgaceae bacterium 311]|nr:hypothetical protein D770_16280 [Flammeovirgaceae bacterium 311]
MRNYLFFSALILLISGLPPKVSAQEAAKSDSLTALHNTISFYREKARDNSFLYHGREYIGFDNRIEGHAFFLNNEWRNGNLYYKGQLYQQVPMLYDIAAEELVVQHYAGVFKIRLFKELISYFELSGHHFINIAAVDPAAGVPAAGNDAASGAVVNDAKGSPMIPGFYDLLYQGDTQLLVKRRKNIKETFMDRMIHREFDQKNLYFIKKEGAYYPVKSRGSALRVLGDQKKEVRQFLSRNKIKFRNDPEHALMKMVEYYDQAQATDQP